MEHYISKEGFKERKESFLKEIKLYKVILEEGYQSIKETSNDLDLNWSLASIMVNHTHMAKRIDRIICSNHELNEHFRMCWKVETKNINNSL